VVDSVRKCIAFIEPDFRRRWWGLIALSVLVSLVEATGAVLVLSLLQVVNEPSQAITLPVLGDVGRFLPDLTRGQQFAVAAGVVGVFFALRGGLVLFQFYQQYKIAGETTIALSRRLLGGYLAMPFPWHLATNSARLVRNLTESTEVVSRQAFIPLIAILSETAVIVAIVAVLLVTAPLVTVVAGVALTLVVVGVLRAIQPRIEALGTVSQDMIRASIKSLNQTLEGAREVKLYRREAFFREEFVARREQFVRTNYTSVALGNIPRIAVETIFVLFILGFLAVTMLSAGTATRAVAVIGLFAYAVLRVIPSLNRVTISLTNLRFGVAAIDILHEDLETVEREAATTTMPGRRLPFRSTISLDHVSFRFQGGDSDVLHDVDLRLEKGQWLGVVGPTGGGKSTLVDVVSGLLRPTHGVIRVDGVDIQEDVVAWQANIGIVPQMLFVQDDTLRRNVAFGLHDDEIDDEQLVHALHLAQLETLVDGLPNGLDTVLGERGARLSGGQRQRVVIARALYHQPEVLVFDEGTSALDAATERQLLEALENLRGSYTLVIVAHRLTTVQGCDAIALVEDGRIERLGSYDELVARSRT
jgi:ATP-binding cassette subfamily C protein